jgi:hypothetical protein
MAVDQPGGPTIATVPEETVRRPVWKSERFVDASPYLAVHRL